MLLDVQLLKDVDDKLGQDAPPQILWHYTTVSGACEIIRSRSLRMGCHAFMNDPAEGTVAGSIVSDAWKAAIDSSTSHPRLDLSYIRDTASVLSYFDFGRPELPPTFLFSLTELGDSLSQWSRYGENGAGIALGFAVSPKELPPASGKPWTTGTQLTRIDYDSPDIDLASRVRPIVENLLQEYLPRFRDPTEIENTLIALVHHLNPIVKHGAYFEEREWRVTTRTVVESHELYDIVCNRHGIAPYVSLPLDHGLELVEFMLGPKLSPENNWSATWLCKKFGLAPMVSRSALAYR